ncbi:MAG: 3-oxoacyl-ACP synthase III family protein [Polyangiales bacterium]
MNATIRGLGAYFPEEIRGNDAWPPAFHEQLGARAQRDISRIEPASDDIGAIMMRHAARVGADPFRGTTRRHVAPETMTPSEAEARAAERALEGAGIDPRDVDLVLSHSLVPDRLTPPNAPLVAMRTGCTRAAAFGLDAVCASAVAQLVLGAAMIESGRARFVLAVQSHLIVRTLDLLEPSSVFLGDAATAMVLGPAPEGRGLLAHVTRADGSFHGAVTWTREGGEPGPWYRGGKMRPGSDDRDAVRRMSAQLLHLGVETCRELFDRGRVRSDDVAAIASIQPTSWYTAALAEALSVPEARVPTTYPQIAHVGAAGVVANLLEARARGLLEDGSLVALYAHGAGANRTGALLRWG